MKDVVLIHGMFRKYLRGLAGKSMARIPYFCLVRCGIELRIQKVWTRYLVSCREIPDFTNELKFAYFEHKMCSAHRPPSHQMFRIISCVVLFSTLIAGFPFPFPAAPVVPPPTAVIPTPFPFVPGSTPVVPTTVPFATPVRPVIPTPVPVPLAPGARPVLPAINNPYYNYAGGPAIPILSYSSEHGVDGTYAFSFSTADGKQAQESGYLKDAFIDNAGNPQGTQDSDLQVCTFRLMEKLHPFYQ
ncbi:hypothetical protein HF086_010766 [Spodoptera exigua]|uniref:Uncharacterized protein n=1 Tax=Spodoptera exigua TaxID=7107 RepID=A0A922LZQ4_SPOEX|nr:hypothetical protein HF086_010766 [Spodoptera exigua]